MKHGQTIKGTHRAHNNALKKLGQDPIALKPYVRDMIKTGDKSARAFGLEWFAKKGQNAFPKGSKYNPQAEDNERMISTISRQEAQRANFDAAHGAGSGVVAGQRRK